MRKDFPGYLAIGFVLLLLVRQLTLTHEQELGAEQSDADTALALDVFHLLGKREVRGQDQAIAVDRLRR